MCDSMCDSMDDDLMDDSMWSMSFANHNEGYFAMMADLVCSFLIGTYTVGSLEFLENVDKRHHERHDHSIIARCCITWKFYL